MNPIEARHHLKFDEYFAYREGVVCNRPVKQDQGSWADIGLKKVALKYIRYFQFIKHLNRLQFYISKLLRLLIAIILKIVYFN